MADISNRRAAIAGVCGAAAVGVLLVWGSVGLVGRAAVHDDPWRGPAPKSVHPGIVVVELFTSEGCSSCPPADEVLSRLVREPTDGTTVLGLGEHVDYWDRLGWKDPFSAASFSARQGEYQQRVFRMGSLYTPQLVVDGRLEVIGSDVSAVRRAIAEASQRPKAALDVLAWATGTGGVGVHVTGQLPSSVVVQGDAEVVVAVTESGLTSEVRRGENGGRTLHHSAVVRELKTAAMLERPARRIDASTTVRLDPGWSPTALTVVAFLQERESRRIFGAGSARIEASGARAGGN